MEASKAPSDWTSACWNWSSRAVTFASAQKVPWVTDSVRKSKLTQPRPPSGRWTSTQVRPPAWVEFPVRITLVVVGGKMPTTGLPSPAAERMFNTSLAATRQTAYGPIDALTGGGRVDVAAGAGVAVGSVAGGTGLAYVTM